MQSFAQRVAATAQRLLKYYGDSPVTFTRSFAGGFDPRTGKASTPPLFTYTTQGVSSNFTQAELTSSNVQYGDMKYTIYPPVDGTIPQVGDTVVLNSITYRIMNVINTNLQDTIIIFDLQLRV